LQLHPPYNTNVTWTSFYLFNLVFNKRGVVQDAL
ncbi:MAG: hypothetical protein RLZ12_245, partial [Bacillota bacterium]